MKFSVECKYEIAIVFDLPAAVKEGVPFYWTRIGAIASPGNGGVIPRRHIALAVCNRTSAVLFDRKG